MRQRPLDSQILRRFNIRRMSEYFRRVIIKFFLKKNLISATLATSLSTSGWTTHPAWGYDTYLESYLGLRAAPGGRTGGAALPLGPLPCC